MFRERKAAVWSLRDLRGGGGVVFGSVGGWGSTLLVYRWQKCFRLTSPINFVMKWSEYPSLKNENFIKVISFSILSSSQIMYGLKNKPNWKPSCCCENSCCTSVCRNWNGFIYEKYWARSVYHYKVALVSRNVIELFRSHSLKTLWSVLHHLNQAKMLWNHRHFAKLRNFHPCNSTIMITSVRKLAKSRFRNTPCAS